MNKNKVLLIGIIAIGVLVSGQALIKVFQLGYLYKTSQEKLDAAQGRITPKVLKQDNLSVSRGAQEKQIINLISTACNLSQVKIVEIEPSKVFQDKAMQYIDQQIVVQGLFVDILRCLSTIQADLQPAKIASMQFKKIQTPSKEAVLTMRICFQYVTLEE